MICKYTSPMAAFSTFPDNGLVNILSNSAMFAYTNKESSLDCNRHSIQRLSLECWKFGTGQTYHILRRWVHLKESILAHQYVFKYSKRQNYFSSIRKTNYNVMCLIEILNPIIFHTKLIINNSNPSSDEGVTI